MYTHDGMWKSGGIFAGIKIGTKWRWVPSFTFRSLYSSCPCTHMMACGKVEVYLRALTSVRNGDECLVSRSGRFVQGKNGRYPLYMTLPEPQSWYWFFGQEILHLLISGIEPHLLSRTVRSPLATPTSLFRLLLMPLRREISWPAELNAHGIKWLDN